jgi:hypothetical protein
MEVLSIPKIRISIKTILPILAAILLIGGGNIGDKGVPKAVVSPGG